MAPAARAQSESSDQRYNELIAQALEEYDLRDFGEAHALFDSAHKLKPSSRTLRGLGFTSFELHEYVRARGELEAALSDPRQPLTPEQRGEVERLLARIDRYVARLRLQVRPPDASLSLDGTPLTDRDVTVNLGDHELTAQAPGYQTLMRRLRIDGGTSVSFDLELIPSQVDPRSAVESRTVPGPAILAPTASTTPASESNRTVFETWWFWTAVGAVVAASVVTTVALTSHQPAAKAPESGDVGGVVSVLRRQP